MKKLIIIGFAVLFSLVMNAQTDYEAAVKSALTEFEKCQSLGEMKAIASKFERIAQVEKNEWLPRYYSAFIACIMAFKTENVADKKLLTDFAQKQLNEAMAINPKESELYTLQGMVYQAIITVDPMNNGQLYSGKAASAFGTARQLNPANPRPLYLQGLSVLYTPEQYGGGKKAALDLFLQANDLFLAFVPASDIAPNWGKDDCAKNLELCKE